MHGCYTQNIEVWFSLFLVRTSIGIGHVVGTIIPQYENKELITEGLSILTQWNPDWKPRFFMMDKSSVELGPVAAVHPQCFRLLCDFHRAQAVKMWVNKGTNGVHPTDKALVITSTGVSPSTHESSGAAKCIVAARLLYHLQYPVLFKSSARDLAPEITKFDHVSSNPGTVSPRSQ